VALDEPQLAMLADLRHYSGCSCAELLYCMLVDTILLNKIIEISRTAGEQILTIYNQTSDFEVVVKGDDSPLTQADLASHHCIEQALAQLVPNIPIISEESVLPEFEVRKHWQTYWLIDPLDGTKEFIGRNGEFTVNIALIHEGLPVLGVVHVPVSNVSYAGFTTAGGNCAFKVLPKQKVDIIVRSAQERVESGLSLDVVASRHHRAETVSTLCEQINTVWGVASLRAMGSSLKICLVAEGQADLYPRFGPTSEWDTAAAQAIVEAAGGYVLTTKGVPLRYNQKSSVLNPDFFVIGKNVDRWKDILCN